MLLAGSISHTNTRYMDFVNIFNVPLDLSTIVYWILVILVGVELILCIIVTLSKNAITRFLESTSSCFIIALNL